MLIEFTVENFMSFRDKTVFSMAAGSGKEHAHSLLSQGNKSYIRVASIYGANASGKTNLHKAITAAILMIRESHLIQSGQPLRRVVPFILDDISRSKPTLFEFVFMSKGIKYIYGFKANTSTILYEYLYEYKTSWPSKIFDRVNTNEYEFGLDKKELGELSKRNLPNKLFLSTISSWNYRRAQPAFEWFINGVETYDTTSWDEKEAEKYIQDTDEKLKNFTRNLLSIADSNIMDFTVEKQEIPKEQLDEIRKIPFTSEFFSQFDSTKPIMASRVSTFHQVKNEASSNSIFQMDIGMESRGTQRLFFMSPTIMSALEKGKVILIDEIDSSLHPLLSKEIVEFFQNPKINLSGAQLIFNTHDVNLMSLDLLRRDQVYFVEKNRDTAASELFSLDEFAARQTEDIRKSYLQGRYGAIPSIGRGEAIWQQDIDMQKR